MLSRPPMDAVSKSRSIRMALRSIRKPAIATVSAAEIRKVRAVLTNRFPSLADAPLLESRVCQYENTSNGDFLIDRHPGMPNVWLVGAGRATVSSMVRL